MPLAVQIGIKLGVAGVSCYRISSEVKDPELSCEGLIVKDSQLLLRFKL